MVFAEMTDWIVASIYYVTISLVQGFSKGSDWSLDSLEKINGVVLLPLSRVGYYSLSVITGRVKLGVEALRTSF